MQTDYPLSRDTTTPRVYKRQFILEYYRNYNDPAVYSPGTHIRNGRKPSHSECTVYLSTSKARTVFKTNVRINLGDLTALEKNVRKK